MSNYLFKICNLLSRLSGLNGFLNSLRRCVYFAVFILAFIQINAYGDSLWAKRVMTSTNLFADNRARHVGDTVTVIINEKTDIQGLEDTELETKSNFKSTIDASAFFVGKTNTEHGNPSSFNQSLPNASGSFESGFGGNGDYESSRDINFRLTAMVTEVLGNGNLLIEGKRGVNVNKESYTIRVSGIIRPIDIDENNVVISEKIANASITLEGKGFLTRTGKRGWAYRLRDIIWPF